MSSITISLLNQIGSNTKNYTVYVLGFSSTSKKQLAITSGTTAKFETITAASGDLNCFTLGQKGTTANPEITAITVDADEVIKGARIYFFFSDNSVFTAPPKISFSGNGANVVNVPNPPNTSYAPYTFAEFTNDPTYGAVIDSQTVDGFTAPVTIEISDKDSNSLGKVGQPLTLNRQQVIDTYAPFINALKDSTKNHFLDLQYSTNGGGLLNPGAFLNDVSAANEYTNVESQLNTLFDNELNTFFATDNLSIQGVAKDSVSAQVYKSESVKEQPLPGSPFTQQALKLTGKDNTFYVYNPVGVCILTDNGKAITGSIDDLTLTFDTPLSEANIQEKMYVRGAGIPADMISVKTVHKSGDKIQSVDFTCDFGTLPPNSTYTFIPGQGIGPKGQPTFVGSIVGNTLTFQTPVTDVSAVKVGYIVEGAGLAGIVSIASVTTDQAKAITSCTISMSLGKPAPHSQYYFSKLKGMFMSSGNMVFANQGLFAYTGDITDAGEQDVIQNLQNQIVTAFCRGVANTGPTSGSSEGYTSTYWGNEENWYPEGVVQNLFSLFMHTAIYTPKEETDGDTDDLPTPLFIQDPNSTQCARNTTMGQAYGFAYDENPMFVNAAAPVPSKFDPVPIDTTSITITLGKW